MNHEHCWVVDTIDRWVCPVCHQTIDWRETS